MAVSSSDDEQGDRLPAHRQDRRHPGCDHRADLEAGHEPADEAVLPRRRIGVEHGDQRPARAHRVAAGLAEAEEELGDRRRGRGPSRPGRPARPSRSWASAATSARSVRPAMAGALATAEDRLGAPVAVGPGEHAAPDGGQGGRRRLARACRAGAGARRSHGPDHRDLPTTPPTSCGHLTSFPRSIGLRAANSSRSGGFRDLVTPMVLKWAEISFGRSAAVLTACAALLLASCSDDEPETGPDDHPGDHHDRSRRPPAPYTDRGEYEVGTYTVALEDGRRVVIWYPAAADAADQPTETFDIASLLRPDLQAKIPADLRVPYEVDAHPGRRAGERELPGRALQPRLRRVPRAVGRPHHPPRQLGVRRRRPRPRRAVALGAPRHGGAGRRAPRGHRRAGRDPRRRGGRGRTARTARCRGSSTPSTWRSPATRPGPARPTAWPAPTTASTPSSPTPSGRATTVTRRRSRTSRAW